MLPLAAYLCINLFWNTSVLGNATEISPISTSAKEPSTRKVEGEEKVPIFNEVLERQTELELCEDGDDLRQNLEQSDVYVRDETQYLVRVLCFNAAYQGNYEFVSVNTAQTPWEMRHADFDLVGYPTFDPKSSILTNSYKFNGVGTCLETSSYYWDGYALRLVSSRLVDGIPNGCQDLGVRTPVSEALITATRVGIAQLGMTLGELRQRLPETSRLEPTELGVDLPSGLQVSFYGEAQFKLGFDTFDPDTFEERPLTEESKIQMIIVDNPHYRTAAGVGPGTLLKDAIAQYGAASLSYHTEAESREWIEFANAPFPSTPDSQVWFRSNQWTVTNFAGIYPDSTDSYQQTQEYHDHAGIGSIWIMQKL